MRFAAVLNQDGGTLRTIDMETFSEQLRQTLEAAGHSVDIDIVAGRDIATALEKAIASRNV
ncbi:diacylglycerol kinase family lipid kinase, partial [Mesorhizobium sp. M1C.F.Ca.ET.144.01.1.1]